MDRILNKYEISTIFIGGGTPSFINEKHIDRILNEIRKNNAISNNAEITIEVNPGTVDENKIKKYKFLGINRLSIGLQSTNNDILKLIGRIHNYEEFINTYSLARKVGFKNINVDLMIGLPSQKKDDVKNTLEKVINLSPEHISVYSLILENGTKLERKVADGELILPKENKEREMYWEVKEILEKSGYIQYEISNFAKPGYESKHNLNCWTQKEYIGFGVGAHSYINGKRFSNIDDIDEYLEEKFIVKNDFPPHKENCIIHEIQNKDECMKEYMMLGLRKIKGVSIADFIKKFNENPKEVFKKELENLTKQNLISVNQKSINLTNKGLDFANLVWQNFV